MTVDRTGQSSSASVLVGRKETNQTRKQTKDQGVMLLWPKGHRGLVVEWRQGSLCIVGGWGKFVRDDL